MHTNRFALTTFCIVGLVGGVTAGEHQPKSPVDAAAALNKIKTGGRKEQLAALRQLRSAAVHNKLGKHKGNTIALCVTLMHGKDNDVASAACDVLSWLDVDAVPPLVKALQSKSPITQSRAARGLSSIASRHRAQAEKLDVALPHLAKLLNDKANSARHNAFYAISQFGPRAIPHMIKVLNAEDKFQWVMMRSFVRQADHAIEPLCAALQKGDVQTRRNAAFMLFHISWRVPKALPLLQRNALRPLTKAISDRDQLVRSRVIETLGRMEDRAQPALGKIIAALDQPDAPFSAIANATARIGPQVKHLDALFDGAHRSTRMATTANDRENAAGRFGRAIGAAGEKGLARIIVALDDKRDAVRETAMYALLALGPKAAPAVPMIIQRLNKGDRLATELLGVIGPKAKAAVPHLIRRMAKDTWARPRSFRALIHYSASANALAAIGRPAVPALLQGLKHKNNLVVAGCVVAFAKMSAKVKVPLAAIQPLTNHENAVIRIFAMRALVQHGMPKEKLVPILRKMQTDTHPTVANAARRAISKLKLND